MGGLFYFFKTTHIQGREQSWFPVEFWQLWNCLNLEFLEHYRFYYEVTFCIVLVFIYEIFISPCARFFVEKLFLLLQHGMNPYSYRRISYDQFE